MSKLTKKTLNRAFCRYFFGLASNQTFSQLQTLGYMWSMLPVIQELYADKEAQNDRLKVYGDVFNTEPQIGAGIAGITARLEEDKANGEDIPDDLIRTMRSGLAGSLAGIGDSMIVGTYIPFLLGLALDFAVYGSAAGIILYLLVWIGTCAYGQRWFFQRGYEMRENAVNFLIDDQSVTLRHSIVLGAILVFGAIGGKFIHITTSNFIYSRLEVLFPNLVTFGCILLSWYFLAKKKMNPRKVMLILALIAVVGSVCGILVPPLS